MKELALKDSRIREFIEFAEVAGRGWKIRDYWDADTSAIGLVSVDDSRLVYVSVFGHAANGFDFVLERRSDDLFDHVEEGTVDSPDALLQVCIHYLDRI